MKTILILKANPKTTSSLALDREVRTVREALQLPSTNDKFFLENRGAIRAKDLQGILREVKPQIVHFAGHGGGETGLILETDDGEQQNITASALADLFAEFKQQIECIILNACYSDVQAQAISEHINYVIGMDREVLDEAAIAFSQGFYTAIRDELNRRDKLNIEDELNIKEAHKQGQIAIQLQMSYKIDKQIAELERKAVDDPDDSDYDPNDDKTKKITTKVLMSTLHLIPHFHQKSPLNEIVRIRKPIPSQSNFDSLVGHSDWIRSLCFSSDGKMLISSSNDKTVRVWDLTTRQLKHLFIGHHQRIKAIGISPNCKYIVTGSFDSKIKIWEVDKLNRQLTSEAFRTINISSSNLTLVNSLPINNQIFVTGNGNGKIKIWEVETGKWQQTFQGHSSSVFALALSPDGQTLVSGSYEKTIKIWGVNGNLSECRKILTNAHLDSILSLAIGGNKDNEILVSASADHTIKRWDLTTGKPTEDHHILQGHAGKVWCIAIHGDKIASASADYTIKIWNLYTGELLTTLTDHIGEIRTLAFSHNGEWLASAGDDLEIKLWDMTKI